jgi:DNA-3-methyladenine glycosylase II
LTRGRAIRPDGPFSLALAAGFGFGPRRAEESVGAEPALRLAFPLDRYREHAAAIVRQPRPDEVRIAIHAGGDARAVERQIARVLSLDRSGTEWLRVGERDPVIGELQRRHPGLRPVSFNSPYEAAAWAVISHRRGQSQGQAARERLAEELGDSFELEGEVVRSFPLPARLCEPVPLPGLDGTRADRLRAVAAAARDGRLDAERLREMDLAAAMSELQKLPGIGPFYAGLIAVRATGATDSLAVDEPIVRSHAGRFYGREDRLSAEEFRELAESWRPFRTWASVLIRYAGDRAGFPRPPRGR